MSSKWIISYRYRPTFKSVGGSSSVSDQDAIAMIDKHPGIWLAEARRRAREIENGPYDPRRGPQRYDEIIRIYSAIELTEAMKPSDLEELL